MLPLVAPLPELTEAERVRTARQRVLPGIGDEGQRRLAAARVLVLGAGGLGGPALLTLAAAGVGTLGIVDDDVVEASNLQRQLVHGHADVGRSKVDSAADAVAAIACECRVRRHPFRLDGDNAAELFAEYDLVLDGTDDFTTRYVSDDAAAAAGIPLVWAVVLGYDAQVTVFWGAPNDGTPGVRLTDLFPLRPEDDGTSCAASGVLGPLTTHVGSLMAIEAVKLITGTGAPLLGRMLVLDALRSGYRELPLRAAAHERDARPAAARAAFARPPVDPTPTIDADNLRARLTSRAAGTDEFVLLDVREPAERAERVIAGSVGVPVGSLGEAAVADWPRQVPVVVHCHAEGRARRAAGILTALGFDDVSVLAGGIADWRDDA